MNPCALWEICEGTSEALLSLLFPRIHTAQEEKRGFPHSAQSFPSASNGELPPKAKEEPHVGPPQDTGGHWWLPKYRAEAMDTVPWNALQNRILWSDTLRKHGLLKHLSQKATMKISLFWALRNPAVNKLDKPRASQPYLTDS